MVSRAVPLDGAPSMAMSAKEIAPSVTTIPHFHQYSVKHRAKDVPDTDDFAPHGYEARPEETIEAPIVATGGLVEASGDTEGVQSIPVLQAEEQGT